MSKKFISTTMSRRDIINKMRHGKLNANPIGQRPAIPDKSKPVKIINAMIDEFFTGAIILRDIRKDEKAQKIDSACKKLLVNDIIEEYEVLG